MPRITSQNILTQAASIVRGYPAGITLRQLFYRLVVAGTIPNLEIVYSDLSNRIAKAVCRGEFPDLIDLTRQTCQPQFLDGEYHDHEWLSGIHRRDRTKGREVSVYLGVEKRSIVPQLESWFDDLGIPILAFGGSASQTYVQDVTADVLMQEHTLLLYAGDADPLGEHVERFIERTNCFTEVFRVALTLAQVEKRKLPPRPLKEGNTCSSGELLRFEMDALDPETLRALFQAAIDEVLGKSLFERAAEQEAREQQKQRELAEQSWLLKNLKETA